MFDHSSLALIHGAPVEHAVLCEVEVLRASLHMKKPGFLFLELSSCQKLSDSLSIEFP